MALKNTSVNKDSNPPKENEYFLPPKSITSFSTL
jgi:hypothetical protein